MTREHLFEVAFLGVMAYYGIDPSRLVYFKILVTWCALLTMLGSEGYSAYIFASHMEPFSWIRYVALNLSVTGFILLLWYGWFFKKNLREVLENKKP